MNTLLLSMRDLQELVRRVGVNRLMDDLIDRLTAALVSFDEDRTEIPMRTGFHYESPVTGLIEWMPLLQKQSEVLMKIVGYHPQSPDTLQLPTILSTLSRYDPTTGHLVALLDGTFVTAMRTGAASAVASRLLAKPDSSTLGLIGCGAQAVTQLHAIGRLFELSDVLIYDVDQTAMETFRGRIAGFGADRINIRPLPAEELVAASDILCVATSVPIGQGPVFDSCLTKSWLHVNAVGSDFPGKIELPKSLLLTSFVCPDNLEQAKREGESQQLAAQQIGADLVAVARRAGEFEMMQGQKTVFDSTGWALEDQVAMDLLLEHAREFAIGSEIQIECISDDPRDPYEFLTSSRGPDQRQLAIEVGARS
jgi:ornithine cyclodeaminase/alanine dehydrogenase-like protein (mu-crystallin family)